MLLGFFQSNRYYVSGYFFLCFFQIFHTIELVIMRVSPPSNHSLCRHQTTFYFWLERFSLDCRKGLVLVLVLVLLRPLVGYCIYFGFGFTTVK